MNIKLKRRVLAISVPILILVIGAIILAILYLTTDIFTSNNELFWKYFSQSSEILELLKNDKSQVQSAFKSANSYNTNGDLQLSINQGQTSIKQMNVKTSVRHDANTNRTYADAILKNGDIDLFKVSYINSEDIYAIKCDDVLKNYIGVQNSNLKELASKYGIISIDNVPDKFNINEYLSVLQNTNEQNQHLIQTYLPIIKNNITSEQYSKMVQNIQINGTTFKTNVYAVMITAQNVKQILMDSLNKLKNDTETLVLLSNKFATLNMGIDYTDITNLSLKVNELAEKLENMEWEDDIYVYLYEYNNDVIRIEARVSDKVDIIFDNTENKQKLTLTFDAINNTMTGNYLTNNNDNNETIDLDNRAVDNQEVIKSQVSINKNTSQNATENIVTITPDVSKPDEDITITINMSSIQNNSINNIYALTYNYIEGNTSKNATINFNVNTTKADQVEEITELTSSNAVIANNYNSEQFIKFITEWERFFEAKLQEKLKMIGFDLET